MPDELSGGQQRRVALARALARDPQLLLLDEPFSSLDTPVRSELSRKLRAIQRDATLSTVLVTHDPEEAALLADEVIVIDHGRALQQGRVEDVFARPASPQVAALLGIANTHPGTVVGPGRIRSGRLEVLAATGDLPADTEITWAIRPELISVDATGSYRAQLVDMVRLVGVTELTLALDGVTLRARRPDVAAVAVGTAVGVELPPEAITVWPAHSG